MKQVDRLGRFEVQERLRANAFVIVYRGRDPFDGRRVQIKVCVATDEAVRRRFLMESEKASSLRHPNIATIFEFGSGDAKPYLVQEAFSEESLSDLLVRGEPSEDVLKLYYLVQIARGLQYAHSRDVLHRELRPASILVDRAGEAKLADFGIARLASAFAQLGNGAHRWPAVGWLLPELLLGLELDRRSDIYGLGALAYELLSGQAPYVAESLAALVPQVLETDPRPLGAHWSDCPPELDRLVLRCLARDPGQRFESMDEVVEELDSIVPVSQPVEVFEEEKTVVIEDHQTIYLAELDRKSDRLRENPAATQSMAPLTLEPLTVLLDEPEVEQVEPGRRERRLGRSAGEAMSTLARTIRQVVGKAAAAFQNRPDFRVNRARLRTTGIVVGSLLLFAVVGWSVARVPSRESAPLPVVAPELPGATLKMEEGLLVIDTQPWGEVRRVAGSDGHEVELPENRYTPLPLKLAPGQYTVEIYRPDLDSVATCVVEVESAGPVDCEPRLAAMDTADFFKESGWWQ